MTARRLSLTKTAQNRFTVWTPPAHVGFHLKNQHVDTSHLCSLGLVSMAENNNVRRGEIVIVPHQDAIQISTGCLKWNGITVA
jgi:hypothetical protein